MNAHADHSRRGLRLSLIGLLINLALAGVKLAAGILGHSYALIADAVESLADVFGSLVVWAGLKIAASPPDEKHPYGHGKAEAIAALIVGGLVIAAGLGIAITSVREMLGGQATAPAAFTLWVLIGVVLVKEVMYRMGLRLSQKSRSAAVFADAIHHRSDAVTSLAAAIGITIALVGGPGYEAADAIAALFAAFIIMLNGARIVRQPLQELMDAAPGEMVEAAGRAASTVQGVLGVETVQARKSGSGFFVDMHIEVDPHMTVHAAHELAHIVKEKVRQELPEVHDVLIHVEPHRGQRGSPV